MRRVLSKREEIIYQGLARKRFSFINHEKILSLLENSTGHDQDAARRRAEKIATKKQRLVDAGILY